MKRRDWIFRKDPLKFPKFSFGPENSQEFSRNRSFKISDKFEMFRILDRIGLRLGSFISSQLAVSFAAVISDLRLKYLWPVLFLAAFFTQEALL